MSDVVSVGSGWQSQHEAMAAVMARIFVATAGSYTTAQGRRKGKSGGWAVWSQRLRRKGEN